MGSAITLSSPERPLGPSVGVALRALALATLLIFAPPTFAGAPLPGADVASVRDWLIANNPELQAMQAEADAAQARIYPAGALPDPMASIEWQEIDPDRPTLLPANVGSTTYGVKQAFPLWGKRALARDIAGQQAEAVRMEREATALTLLAQAEAAYVRYWHAREGVVVVDRLIELLGSVEEVARSRYALGVAAQQDSIQAQVARTNMQRERIERMAVRREATAMLNAVIGRPADAPLAEPASEPVLGLPAGSLAQSLAALANAQHPALQARLAVATAADTAAQLQRRQRLPDLTLGVGLMQRDDRVDSLEVMLEVEIPLQQQARRDREREAILMGDAARSRVQAMRDDLQGRLGQAWAQADSARDQRRLIEQTLLPQSQANFESALASYQVGDVDFGTLLAALEAWQGADLSRVDVRRDEFLGAAAVRAIVGSVE
jgi:cobalt-zinc-cadmium efflux system outer membrane protein